jgi:phenylpropionate dioxygenase-like ring-hydroxylating dioxygenase large terminal subunit
MTFVRNAWYVAAWGGDIAPERLFGIHILDEPLVIWRNAAGELAALEDRCIHRLAPLSLGRCEGEKLRCLYHGLLFDRTGRVVGIPGQNRVSGTLRVRSYPVVERHDWIWVWMGDLEPDESLIPPVKSVNSPGYGDYISGHSHNDYSAESFLVTDNIADISHVPFLHRDDPELDLTFEIKPPKFTKYERSVRTEWWMRMQAREEWMHMQSAEEADAPIEQYARTEFYVPGVLVTRDKFFPDGTIAALDGQAPNLEGAEAVSSHMITPMTKRTTRHFFSAAWPRGYNETVCDSDALVGYFASVFAQDKAMMEAQQRNLDTKPGWRFIPMSTDRGLVMFNQIVETLVREEARRG